MFNLKKALLALCMTALAGCGNKLTGPGYQGEPLFSVSGAAT
jgi:predicted small lipoprotein YifL